MGKNNIIWDNSTKKKYKQKPLQIISEDTNKITKKNKLPPNTLFNFIQPHINDCLPYSPHEVGGAKRPTVEADCECRSE